MSISQKYKIIIFDLDMTLIDTSIGSSYCYDKAFQFAEEKYCERDLPLYMSEFLDKTYSRLSSPKISYKEFETEFYRHSHKVMAEKSVLFHDTRIVLDKLFLTNTLAIVTNKDRKCVLSLLAYHNIPLNYFKSLICCDDIKEKKPNPKPLLLCMKQLAAAPTDCIYIGDSATDIEFAENAKIDVRRINRYSELSEGEIGSLLELI